MANMRHRHDFVLTLAPNQSIAGHFQVALNLDTDPITYVVSGAFGAKTFTMSYATPAAAKAGLDQIFLPIHLFLEDLEQSAPREAPEVLRSHVFLLDFPNTGGDNLVGSLQLSFDWQAVDRAQLLMQLDGASITVKRVTIEDVLAALQPLSTIRAWLVMHARMDIANF
jgi:hypothetical protein